MAWRQDGWGRFLDKHRSLEEITRANKFDFDVPEHHDPHGFDADTVAGGPRAAAGPWSSPEVDYSEMTPAQPPYHPPEYSYAPEPNYQPSTPPWVEPFEPQPPQLEYGTGVLTQELFEIFMEFFKSSGEARPQPNPVKMELGPGSMVDGGLSEALGPPPGMPDPFGPPDLPPA